MSLKNYKWTTVHECNKYIFLQSHRQDMDMTQGKFFSRLLLVEFKVFLLN